MTNEVIYTAREWGNKFSLRSCKKHPSHQVNSYHNTAKLIETLEGMRSDHNDSEAYLWTEGFNIAIDEMIEHLAGNRDDKN